MTYRLKISFFIEQRFGSGPTINNANKLISSLTSSMSMVDRGWWLRFYTVPDLLLWDTGKSEWMDLAAFFCSYRPSFLMNSGTKMHV